MTTELLSELEDFLLLHLRSRHPDEALGRARGRAPTRHAHSAVAAPAGQTHRGAGAPRAPRKDLERLIFLDPSGLLISPEHILRTSRNYLHADKCA